MSKRPVSAVVSPGKPRKRGRRRKDGEDGENDAEVAAQMRRRMILEGNDEDEELMADFQEEGGYLLEDIYIPPKITRQEHPGTGQRLVIEKIVCENFKSYGGLKEMGPFHKSFSAIVGPNGNGKSNIIDAMLFVFGYRASKIRCKKVSTLIHKSELLPDLRSCAVTVHFVKIIDEGDKGKGDDFEIVDGSRIKVMRRAYKDNSSVYYLDGKKVKFQDVAKFLKNSGIDIVHNRFLILQGEVEQIAQMPPISPNGQDSGLLEFLEEVIGTKRYIKPLAQLDERVEKYDYEREEKVQRVDMAEKEKKNMHEPVQKAKEYLRDRNALTKYQYMKCRKTAFLAQSKIELKRKIVEEIEGKMNGLLQRLNEITETNQTRKTEYQNVEKQFKAIEKQYNKAKHALDAADAQYIQCSEDLKRSNETRKKNQKEATKLEADIEKLKGLPESHNKSIEELQGQKIKLDGDIQTEQNRVQGDLEKLNNKVDAALKKKEIADKEFTKLKSQRDAKKSALDKLQKEINNYREREAVEQKKLADMADRLETLKSNIHQKEKDGRTSLGQNKLGPMEQKFNQLQKNVQGITEEENRHRQVFEQARTEYQQAHSSIQGSKEMGQADRLLMEAKADGMFPGLYGRLKNLATIPEKYNIAASAATGWLEYWVADNDQTSADCIALLKSKGVPVQSFLCLDKMSGEANQLRKRFDAPAQSQRIFDLLNISKPDVAPAFYKAFRNVLVTENMDIATKVSYGGAQRHRVVTLQGEIVETTGSMVGGGNARPEGKFNSRSAQVTVSKQQLAHLLKCQEDAQKKYFEAQQARKDVETELHQVSEQIQDFKRKINNYQSDLQALKSQLPLQESNIESQRQRTQEAAVSPKVLKEKETALKNAQKEYEEYLEPCQNAEDAASKLGDQVQELQVTKKKEITLKLDKLVDMRKKVVDETNKKTVELKNCEANKKKAETKLASARREVEKMEDAMKRTAEKKSDLEQKGKEIKEEEQELLAKMEEAKQLYEQKKQHSNEFQDEERKLLKEKATVENKLTDSKQELKHIENQMASANEQSKQLVIQEIPEEQTEALPELTEEQIKDLSMDDIERKIKKYNEKLKRDTPNLDILKEYKNKLDVLYQRVKELAEVTKQRDLFRETYCKLDQQRATEFMEGFALISSRLKEMFRMISMGGDAELEVVDILDLFGCGVQFSVRPARKTWKKISNLSGGEKTLASLSLVFALHHFKPSPFYVMDEIDAALDFKNVSIIANYIKDRTKFTQFIIISLRSNMFELADSLLGVYKVDNMSYSIHFGVRRLVNEMRAKQLKENVQPDKQDMEVKKEDENTKAPKGFPNINVSAIPNPEELNGSHMNSSAVEQEVSQSEEDTVIEANGTLQDNNAPNSDSQISSVADVAPLAPVQSMHEMSTAGSEDLFEDMDVQEAQPDVRQPGPLAASTPYIRALSAISGGFLRPSQESEPDTSFDDASAIVNDPNVSQSTEVGSDESFKTAEADSSKSSLESKESDDEIGPTP